MNRLLFLSQLQDTGGFQTALLCTVSGWGESQDRGLTPASTKAVPLPFVVTSWVPLSIHSNKGFQRCKMFEKCYSRALGQANLRPSSLLPALITFTNQWSNHLNCFPFTGKTKTETLVTFPTISPVLGIFASVRDTWYIRGNSCWF